MSRASLGENRLRPVRWLPSSSDTRKQHLTDCCAVGRGWLEREEEVMSMKFIEMYGQPSPFDEVEVTGVTNDSRKLKKGMVFVCLQGTGVDGHQYAREAEQAGASVIVAERDTGAKNQLIVEKIAARSTPPYAPPSLAIPHRASKLSASLAPTVRRPPASCSSGCWSSRDWEVGLIGTIQNVVGEQVLPAHNTTPDASEIHSLLSLMEKAGCEYVVMEVSSHALDQERVYGLRFAAGVFTNLTQDHLDYHKTMENYLACKKAGCFMPASARSSILTMRPLPKSLRPARGGDGDLFGRPRRQRLQCEKHPASAGRRRLLELVGNGVIGRVSLQIPGEFSVYNAMAAGVCALALGCPFHGVLDALSSAKGVKGRVEVVPTGRDFTVVIDYAHTPDGLLNVTKAMNKVKTGRLVTLFGCGGDRDRLKRPIMGQIAAEQSDYVIVTSDNPRSENPRAIIDDILVGMKHIDTPYTVIEDRKDAIAYALEHAQSGDLILLAGKGHETYQILSTGTVHLDEREVVAEVLSRMGTPDAK